MESLKKIESFSELGPGLIVVVKNCQVCGREKCRGIIGRLRVFHSPIRNKSWEGYRTYPGCSQKAHVTADAVSQGRVFRVLDGLEDSELEEIVASPTVRELLLTE